MNAIAESSNEHPYLWLSDCNRFRIICCKDDLQWIVQAWQSPKWRNLSFHTEWNSIAMRWSALNVPVSQPTVTTSTLPQDERDIVSAIMGL
jgi:hypothetical protein